MRLVIHLSLGFIALVCLAAPAVGQQIQGQIRYADTNQPAINTTVRCDGLGGNSVQMTDASGKFRFAVSPGHYNCSVRIPGYKEEQRTADLIDTNSNEYFLFQLKPDGAAKAVASALDGVPEPARKEFEKGESALAGGKKENLEEATLHYEKAMSLYPKYIQAELRLGTTYMDLQKWDKAESALRQAIAIDAKAANAYMALGELYLQQKKNAEAEKALLDGLAIEDRSWLGHFTLAKVYWEMSLKEKDQALALPTMEKSYTQVKRALELNPQHAGAHLLKGNLLFKGRRAQDALVEYEEYLRLEPKGAMSDQTRTLVDKIKKALAETKKP